MPDAYPMQTGQEKKTTSLEMGWLEAPPTQMSQRTTRPHINPSAQTAECHAMRAGFARGFLG